MCVCVCECIWLREHSRFLLSLFVVCLLFVSFRVCDKDIACAGSRSLSYAAGTVATVVIFLMLIVVVINFVLVFYFVFRSITWNFLFGPGVFQCMHKTLQCSDYTQTIVVCVAFEIAVTKTKHLKIKYSLKISK